jgi:hypothetical protein
MGTNIKDDIIPLKEYLIREKLKWLLININNKQEIEQLQSMLLSHSENSKEDELIMANELHLCKTCESYFPKEEMRVTGNNKMYAQCYTCYTRDTTTRGMIKTLRQYIDHEIGNKYDAVNNMEKVCAGCEYLFLDKKFTSQKWYECKKDSDKRDNDDDGYYFGQCLKAKKLDLLWELSHEEDHRLNRLLNDTLNNNNELIEYRRILNRFKDKITKYKLRNQLL